MVGKTMARKGRAVSRAKKRLKKKRACPAAPPVEEAREAAEAAEAGGVAPAEEPRRAAEETTEEDGAQNEAPSSRYDFGVVSLATRKSMQGNKRRDTKPEIKVRRMLREMGFTGYRCDWAKAPGRPDVAFVGRRLAIEIRGCFWHRCPTCNLSVPKKNTEYWEAKFARNRERDERNLAELEARGWKVLVLWEHQLRKKNLAETRRLLYDFVRREDDPPYDEAFPEGA